MQRGDMRNEDRRGKEKHPEYAQPNPMEEENFPDSPARESADREMAEPTNIPGVMPPKPMRRAREEEGEGD